MGIPDISSGGYDIIVGVTQAAINESLATYLETLEQEVALYYTLDGSGDFVACTEAAAEYAFTGVLGYARNPDGNPVNLVTLYDPGQGNQTVVYNVTFKEAAYVQNGHTYVPAPGSPPWVFSFSVSLAQQTVTLDDVPPAVAGRAQTAVQNLVEQMFSIQQLFADLTTARNATVQNVTGMGSGIANNMTAILKLYVQQQAASGNPVFGYAITYTGNGAAPTFVPTSMEFGVSQYTGAPADPRLDTLNYLVMTHHKAQPAYPMPPAFNWTSDPSVAAGGMVVNGSLFTSFLLAELAPILTVVCPTLTADAGAANQLTLSNGPERTFTPVTPVVGGLVAQCSYATTAHDTHPTLWPPGTTKVTSSYSSETQVTLSGNTISVLGSITASATFEEFAVVVVVPELLPPPSISITMPPTTFRWRLDITMVMDPANNGSMNLQVVSDFSAPPTTAGTDQSGWTTFLQALLGHLQSYVSDLGDMRAQVQVQVEGKIVPVLTNALASMAHFIFPGASTFAFKEPRFTPSLDLTTQITYLTPAVLPGGQPAGEPAGQPGGEPAGQPGGEPAGQPGGEPAGQPGGQSSPTYLGLTSGSSLMKNQKAASPISSSSPLFQLAQTSAGDPLVFSMGDDGAFHLTYPVSGTLTGWATTSLTAALAALPGPAVHSVTSFDVGQDPSSGSITVAVTAQCKGGEGMAVFIMAGLSNAPDAEWYGSASAQPWRACPWDLPTPDRDLSVSYMYVTPAGSLVAGVAEMGTRFILNYAVDPATGTWKLLPTAESYDDLLDRALGRAKGAMSDGLYELYTLGGVLSLLFSPFGGVFGPPAVTKLTPPAGAHRIATVPGQEGTDLYATGTGGLFRWSVAQQTNFAAGTLVVPDSRFENARAMGVYATSAEVVAWALMEAGPLLVTRCPRGQEGAPDAWSPLLAVAQNATQAASYLNHVTGAQELFAYSDNVLERITRDPVTSMWRQDNILLSTPGTNVNDIPMVEFYTYTTRLAVTDRDNLPVGGALLQLSSTSPVGVYVNHRYMRLSGTPVTVPAEGDGTVTLVQQTGTVGAVAYFVGVEDGAPQSVNPMAGPLARMATVTDGASLRAVQVSDGKGGTTPLVPSTVPTGTTDAVGQALARLAGTAATLPSDGSVRQAGDSVTLSTRAAGVTAWGVDHMDEEPQYWEGTAAQATLRSVPLVDVIEGAAGDVLRWFGQMAEEERRMMSFLVEAVEGAWKFTVNVGGQAYRFVMDTMNSVVQTAEFVIAQVGVAFEDLVAWVGFVFDWDDILRTHAVIANVIRCYVASVPASLGTLKGEITGLFSGLDARIQSWSGLTTGATTIRSVSAAGDLAAQPSPESSWGLYHLKGGLAETSASFAPTVNLSEGNTLLAELSAAFSQEAQIFETALTTVEGILAGLTDLTGAQVASQLLGVIGTVLTQSAENLLVTLVDVLELLAQDGLDLLSAKVIIPVLSPMYESLTGYPLTTLDLMALVAAVPATILYKVAEGAAPFPDTVFTSRLIDAPDLAAIQALYTAPAQSELRDAAEQASPSRVLLDAMHLVASASSAVFMFISTFKYFAPDNRTAALLQGACFFTTTAPVLAAGIMAPPPHVPAWIGQMSETVYGLTAAQKLLDVVSLWGADADAWKQVSGPADLLLGISAMVPPIASLAANPLAVGSVVGLFAAAAWNGNRVLTPFAKDSRVFLAKMVAVGLYGAVEGFTPALTGT